MADLDKLRTSRIPIVWVLGGPGSGKGTQCARLVEKYGFEHLSTGDLLREEVQSGSDIGKDISDLIVNGVLVSRQIVLDLLKKAMIRKVDTARGYLIDGYPREIEQGEDFERDIAPCSLILYFDCKDETMKQRLLDRGASSGRTDDKEETIDRRLAIFHQSSEPVINHPEYVSKVNKISADTDPDTIFAECIVIVDQVISS